LSRFTFSSTCQPISLIIPALIVHHSFTFSLQTQNLPFQQILPTLDFFYILDYLHDNGTGPDLSRSIAHQFIFSFTFISFFIPCGGLSWLPVSFLLHVKYTLSYRIVYFYTKQSRELRRRSRPKLVNSLPLFRACNVAEGSTSANRQRVSR